MRSTGHKMTGLAAGAIMAVWMVPHNPLWWTAPLLSWYGGKAPDQWEWIGHTGKRWVPHRTLTHWAMPWAALLTFAIAQADQPWAPVMAGFAAAGCMHLVMDLPNPMGVPVLLPFKFARLSLGMWTSGTHDGMLSILTLLVAAAYAFVTLRLQT